jgi:hypothetical protein
MRSSGYSKPAQFVDSCHNACVNQCLHPGSGGGACKSHGSVYVSRTGSHGFSYGWANQFDAMDEASRHRREQKNGACARLLIFENKCAAIVQARRGYDVLGVADGAEPVQVDADAKGWRSGGVSIRARRLPGGQTVPRRLTDTPGYEDLFDHGRLSLGFRCFGIVAASRVSRSGALIRGSDSRTTPG